MKELTFGRLTGLRVSELALGTGNFGTGWETGAEPDTARRMFDRFAESGGTFIDTADGYQAGQSEALLGDFLAADRDHFVLATKFTTAPPNTGNSRKAMVQALEASLKRLKTDRIDLYWVHFPDGITPVEELVRGLDDLARAGKIVYGGLSNFPAWQVARAQTLAELRGLAPIAGIQVEHSLVERSADRELLPMAKALGLGATLWSPLGGGLLTGKYRHSDAGRLTDWNRLIHTESTDQKTAVVDELLAVADELEVPPAQAAIAWSLTRGAVPIIGPRTPEQLEDYLSAVDVELTEPQRERLDAVSAPALGVPHEAARGVQERIGVA